MIELSNEALQERKKIAENAETQGEWEVLNRHMVIRIKPKSQDNTASNDEGPITDEIALITSSLSNAFHIAASSPADVIAMIEEIEDLRAEIAQKEKELDWFAQARVCPHIRPLNCKCGFDRKYWREFATKKVKEL